MTEFEGPTLHLGGDGLPLGQLITQPTEFEDIALGQGLVIGLIGELESEDTEVREILPVDPRQRLRHDHSKARGSGER